ncbi:MAG: class I SAM-dependent methyltransferase [Lachnospiraceae bacterium]|nr:class I SAM-dependent methyltransferase [Lachnospiraceae bacterium]
MIRLSERLKTAAELINPGSVIADIGCDHAYLSVYALQKGLAEFCYCLDINEGPLKRAEKNIAEYGLSDKTEFVLSDGFEKMPEGKADTAVILGMGGGLIQRIISNAPSAVLEQIDSLILGPQSELAFFRQFLFDNAFTVKDEKLIFEEGKFYYILDVIKGKEEKQYKDFELCYGRVSFIKGNENISLLLGKELKETNSILAGKEALPAERYEELIRKRDMIKRAGSAYEI